MNLPVDLTCLSWPGDSPPRRIRLVRRFGRPAALEATASEARARLVVDGAAAVRSVEINGRPESWRSAEPDRLIVDLPPLAARNSVEIVIEPPAAGTWGSVFLVFGGASDVE